MRLLQLKLRCQWDFEDESVVISWTPSNESDLLWWSDPNHLLQGVSLEVQHPDLLLWFDASDLGWGANRQDQFVSGHWSIEELFLSINLHELCAIHLGLQHFHHSLQGLAVGMFTDHTTALSYIRKQGGTFLTALNLEAQLLLRRAESWELTLVPQFIMGPRTW